MAKTGITYEQVHAAALTLEAQGTKVTNRAVREYLGTGSPNVIQRYLAEWREKHPEQSNLKEKELPLPLMKLLAAELDKRAHDVQNKKDEEIKQLMQELDDMTRAADQYEEIITALQQENEEIKNNLHLLQGKYEQLQRDYEKSQKTNEEMGKKTEQLYGEYQTWLSLSNKYKDDKNDLQEKLHSELVRTETYRKELADIKEKHDRCHATNQQLENNLKRLEEEITHIKKQVLEYQKQNLELEKSNTEYRIKLELYNERDSAAKIKKRKNTTERKMNN